MTDYHALPPDLPVPVDDGAADHLPGLRLPALALRSTRGSELDLAAAAAGTLVLYVYPRTGTPGEPSPDGWDAIPGARGCTPQSCAFRDRHAELRAVGAGVLGLSAQPTAEQSAFAAREQPAVRAAERPGAGAGGGVAAADVRSRWDAALQAPHADRRGRCRREGLLPGLPAGSQRGRRARLAARAGPTLSAVTPAIIDRMAELDPFAGAIASEAELRERYDAPMERAVRKELQRLDEMARRLIAVAPLVLVASHDAAGRCDVTPRGGEPGFVTVLDDEHLAIPDATGNNRLDTLRNVVATGHAGLIFLIPGRDQTLRVNGRRVHQRGARRCSTASRRSASRRRARSSCAPRRSTPTARRRSCARDCGTRRHGRRLRTSRVRPRSRTRTCATLRSRSPTSSASRPRACAPAGMSAGYSGTPLPRKLGIKPGQRIAFLDAPPAFDEALGDLPQGVGAPRTTLGGPLDLVVAFFAERSRLERRLPPMIAALDPAGALWIAWPKRASSVDTDLTEDVVRELGLAAGVVDVKVCAIDATWSGLKLVIRVQDRPRR